METSGEHKIRLWPAVFEREDFKFRIRQVGRDRSLLITADEVLAIGFLKAAGSVDAASRLMKRKKTRLEVNLYRLAERLERAGLLREGRPGEESPFKLIGYWFQNAYAFLHGKWRLVKTKSLGVAMDLFPVSRVAAAHDLYWELFHDRDLERRQTAVVGACMNRILGHLGPAKVSELARDEFRFQHQQTRRDLLVLFNAPHPKIKQWILNRLGTLETGALDEALSRGKGALIFYFHLGPIPLVSTILAALRYPVTILGMSTPRARENDMYMNIVDDLSPAGILRLVSALRAGEIVLITPDSELAPHAVDSPTAPLAERFAGAWPRKRRTVLRFFGHEVSVDRGIPWLHAETGAPVLHASIRGEETGKVRFSIGTFEVPERQGLSRKDWEQLFLERIFARYEAELLSNPAQWHHWLRFFRYLPPKKEAVSQLVWVMRNGRQVEIEPHHVLRLHRFSAFPFKQGMSLAVRFGTPTVLLTNDQGLRVLEHLKRGCSLEALRECLDVELNPKPNPEQVVSFLNRTYQSGLVKSVDGVAARSPRVSPGQWLLHTFKAGIYPGIYRFVDERLPLGPREWILPRLSWTFEGRHQYRGRRFHLAGNLRALFPDMSPHGLRKRTKSFFRHHDFADIAFRFTQTDVGRVFGWLDRYLLLDEKDRAMFERLRSGKPSVILAGYHFGPFWLLPALLLKMGVTVHALVGTVFDGKRQVQHDASGSGSPSLTFYNTDIRSVATLPGCLARGETALLFVDGRSAFGAEVGKAVYRDWGKPASVKERVTLCGQPFPVRPGVAWLHRETGAPVLPLVIKRTGKGSRVRLVWGATIDAGQEPPNRQGVRALPEIELLRRLFRQLEDWVRQDPDQWLNLLHFPRVALARHGLAHRTPGLEPKPGSSPHHHTAQRESA